MPRRRRHDSLTDRVHRWISAIGLSIVGVVCLIVLLAVGLTHRTPAWWITVDTASADLARRAEAIEQAVLQEWAKDRSLDPHQTPDGAVWSVAITDQDATAWLNARLPKWLANHQQPIRWPAEVRQLQVRFDSATLTIGALVQPATAPGKPPAPQRVLAATLSPTLASDGSLWLPAHTVSIGRLTLPASWILDEAHAHTHAASRTPDQFIPASLQDRPETAALFAALRGSAPIVNSAVVRLADGRRVRLLKITPKPGRLELTCRTESAN